MSEFSSVKTSSSLAITDSKLNIQKSSGFFGIFFQLFDWNRNFSKKKVSPKKLLPPAGAKLSKKFTANEKLPATKKLLIADENSGGFPSKMKNKKLGFETKKQEMKSPGLVARLMGLESMPLSVDDDVKNVESSPEKANVRPQKLQKIEIDERKTVTRFGNEAFQIKNVLPRSRKNEYHHPKVVSPVKSPKMGRNASRLRDVASRVLEPGKQDLVYEVKRIVDLQSEFSPVSSEVRDSNAHRSGCRSCENVFGRVDVTSVGERRWRDFDECAYGFKDRFFSGLEESRPAVYLENENDVVLLKTGYRPKTRDQIPLSGIFTSQRDESRSIRDRVPQKYNLPKDFIAINRNISRQRGSKSLESRPEANRRSQTETNDFLASQRNPVRKRRTLTSNTQTDKDSVCTNTVSFTFNSPVKSSPERKSHNEVEVRDTIRSVNEKNVRGINGDALGVLLEQKLKELTYQVENEASAGFQPSARTTASILQELISALTTDWPESSEERYRAPVRKDSEFDGAFGRNFQANSRSTRSSTRLSHGIDHFSPECVLNASFSNESCVSSFIDNNSVKLAELSDSASSKNHPLKSDIIMVVTDLVTHTSSVLIDVNRVHAKLTTTKRAYMQDVILNTELLFGNASVHTSSRFVDFLLGPFLDELETLVIGAWKNSIILGIEVRKEENPLRIFLLDCLVECLDVKYSRYINSGFRTWVKLPKTVNADVLIKEFDEEVRKWISCTGKSLDEMVESEMSASLGKWTDFQIEAFENGVEINEDIVQSLVDEIVTDLCAFELSFW